MFHNQDDPQRELIKFYNKTRRFISDLELRKDDTHEGASYDKRTHVEPAEDRLCGLVSKEELNKLLAVYEKQQLEPQLQEEPVSCDKILGQNYAKLLHSKQGFHHFGSTAHLVKELGIRNISRNSFLGGHSLISAKPGEDLASLKKFHARTKVYQITRRVFELMKQNQLDEAYQELRLAHDIDPRNPDVMFGKAQYYLMKKIFPKAIDYLEAALRYDPRDPELVTCYLSDAFYQFGMSKYLKHDFTGAKRLFEKALEYNSQNQGALLHRNLSQDQVLRATPFAQKPPTYRG